MILGFKKRFVPLVRDRSKRHTIRDDAGDRWKAGCIAHPYENVRQKGMALIIEPTPVLYTEVFEVRCRENVLNAFVNGVKLDEKERDLLAWKDGFRFTLQGQEYMGEGKYSADESGCWLIMQIYWKKAKEFPYKGKLVHF